MSLYHEAAKILDTAKDDGGSIKSLVFSNKGWKSDAKTLFALTTESAKWSRVLSEVIDSSALLKRETQVRII
jgi:25S rRNA (cytosine2278-C5)-methyltransferase